MPRSVASISIAVLAGVVASSVVLVDHAHAQSPAQRVSIHRARAPRGGGTFSIVSVSPNDPDLVFVGTTNGIVLRSADGGLTWDRIALSPPSAPALDVSAPGVGIDLAASSDDDDDDDESLDVTGALTHPNVEGLEIGDIAFCESTGGALVGYASTPGRVYRSRDLGMSWEPLHAYGVDGGGLYFECDPTLPTGVILATDSGVARSPDEGESWTVTPLVGRVEARHVLPDPSMPGRVLAATPIGLYAGVPPSDVDSAVYNDRVLADRSVDAQFVAMDESTIYVGMSDGAVVSHDAGRTWSRVAEDDLGRLEISMILLDPRDARHAYFLADERPPGIDDDPFAGSPAVGERPSDVPLGRLFETRDAGRTVVPIDVSASAGVLEAITLDPENPDRIWLLTDDALFVLEPPPPPRPFPRSAVATRAALAIRRDPGLAVVMRTALRRARLGASDEAELRADLARAAWMPVISVELGAAIVASDRDIAGIGSYRLEPAFRQRGDPNVTRLDWVERFSGDRLQFSDGGAPTRDTHATTMLSAFVTFTWSLDRAPLDARQTSRAWLDARRVRRETQAIVADAYVERRRLLVELATRAMSSATSERVALRVEELTSLLDGMTGSIYGGSLGEQARGRTGR